MLNICHGSGKITGIYCIENLLNNNQYIGSSKHVYYRLRRHLSDLRANRHKNPKLQNAFNKYGEDMFYTHILEVTEELLLKEEFWIKVLNPRYNCVLINLSRLEFSEEHKKHISEAAKKSILEGRSKCNKIAVDVFDIEGCKINTFASVTEFGKHYSITQSKSASLFKGIFTQWKGLRIRSKGQYEQLERYILPKKGCMNITKNKCARIKSDKLLETPEEDNQQPIITLNG